MANTEKGNRVLAGISPEARDAMREEVENRKLKGLKHQSVRTFIDECLIKLGFLTKK